MDLAYATLMSMCTQGTFLYTPAKDETLHPGSCGVFDEGGRWRPITDLTKPEQLKADEYTPIQKPLSLEPPVTCKWERKVVERDEGRGFGVKAEVSGMAAQAPIDLGANAKVGSTAKAGAGLVVSPNVVHKQLDAKARATVGKWVKENVKALSAEQGQNIAEFGVWIILATWVTQKCDISMWNKTGKKIDAGLQIGATNLGKVGLNGSREINTDVDEHKVYDEPGGYAVSFSGLWFRPSTNFFSSVSTICFFLASKLAATIITVLTEVQSLKQRKPRDGFLRTGEAETLRIDENGNLIEEPKPEPEPELEQNSEPEQDIELEIEMVGF